MMMQTDVILTEDLVVNYKKEDKDECLHFLTDLDTSCKDMALLVSPTAKRIYTSNFNAWFLKRNFNVKHIDVQGFNTNQSYKIKFNGKTFIFSFIDSKFTTGSVALLLHGPFGVYLYTGNFCYYSSFLKSPPFLEVIEKKALTRLYLDNMYFEQPSAFPGFEEMVIKVVKLIKSQPMKNFYLHADIMTMGPLLAEIASKLKEKVSVGQSTMEIMKILGYESFFTYSDDARIFIDTSLSKMRGLGHEDIAIYFNRYSESCKYFQKTQKKGNVYIYNFYSHSNHKEICELLRILKPESTTFLFSSEIDKSKFSYFKFNYDLPESVLFNGISTKPSIKHKSEMNKLVKNIPKQLIKSTFINDHTAGNNKDLSIESIVISNTNNEGKNLVYRTSENKEVPNLYKEEKCLLRVREVLEINNAGLFNKLNCITDDADNNCTNNITVNDEESKYKNSNKINITNVQLHSSVENYHKPKPNTFVEVIKLGNYNSAGNILIPKDMKPFSSSLLKTKPGMSLLITPKLLKENEFDIINNKVMAIPNISLVCDDKKKLKRKCLEQSCLTPVSPNGIQKTKLNCVENVKHLTLKRLKLQKTANDNSNIKSHSLLNPHSNILNLSKLVHIRSDDNSFSSSNNNCSQISENSRDKNEESNFVEYKKSNIDSIQLAKYSRNNIIDEDKNKASVDLVPEHINKPAEYINDTEEFISLEFKNCNIGSIQLSKDSRNNAFDEDKNTSSVNLIATHIDEPVEYINEPEKSASVESKNCNINSTQLSEDSEKNADDVDKNTTASIDLVGEEHCINLPSEKPAEKNNNGSSLSLSIIENSLMNNQTANESSCMSIGATTNVAELQPFNKNNENKQENNICEKNLQNSTDVTNNVRSEISMAHDKIVSSRKNPRRHHLSKSSLKNCREPVLRECHVLLKRNSFKRSYFYLSHHECYVPKFLGFKKHEIRPRHMLITLSNLQKLLKN